MACFGTRRTLLVATADILFSNLATVAEQRDNPPACYVSSAQHRLSIQNGGRFSILI